MSAEGTSRNKEDFMKNFQVNFQHKKVEYEEPEPQKKMKRIVHLVRNTISLEHYSSVMPEDWVEEEQAGVKFWANKVTGEASAVCPWREVQVQPRVDKRKQSTHTHTPANISAHNMLRRRSVVVEEPASHLEEDYGAEGTGSLVYDGKELEELFAMLNTAKK
ncbi:hypothetical protein EON63_21795 [archaeon]|nr:MAG: hypothetical protein EON63_21795 [archaeon]